MPQDKIIIRGARQHNLKNINLEIPRDKLVVITGLSGSGKSSLAFDTIYAEGQRRYVESLSAYARQFLEQMDKPDVDFIDGLSPAISIDQKSAPRNPRSTVGTVTEIYDYLRLLFARIGVPYCPNCGVKIERQTVQQITDQILNLPEGTRILVLAPIVKGRKGEYKSLLEEIKREGFTRVRVDGQMLNLAEEEIPLLDKYKIHHIEVIVDRIVLREGIKGRLTDSLETALKMGKGQVIVSVMDGEELYFSEEFACPICGFSMGELEPRKFSFNSPYGACPTCHGLGYVTDFSPDLVFDYDKSIAEGGIIPLRKFYSEYYPAIIRSLAEEYGFSLHEPIKKLPPEIREMLFYGTNRPVFISYVNWRGYEREYWTHFRGIKEMLEEKLRYSTSERVKEEVAQFMATHVCPDCEGKRLKKESLAVKVAGKNIYEVTLLSVDEAYKFFASLPEQLSEKEKIIAQPILKEILARLGFLKDVGLGYLTLERPANTLAGGEAQRIRLATQIGSGLMGVIYILDEPSIGLHPRDNRRLLDTLIKLRDLGNTVIVVEHDEETIRTADWIIDLGPGAGEHGGYVVVSGTLEDVIKEPRSITGQYLSGARRIPVPKTRRKPKGKWLIIKGAKKYNLKGIDVKIPLGLFVAITGVSGSGKSTLLEEIVYPVVSNHLYGTRLPTGEYKGVEGLEELDKVINIDQSPIGRTPRSNPATYTGVFDLIRQLFAQLPEAKARGYKPGRFSFNVKGGRCEACKGDGYIKVEMQFLPDVYVRCEECKGKRYNRETLEIKYKGKTIADVLDMTVEEALHFFRNIEPIRKKLETLYDVGLGYIRLGQPATTLSGGEAQRVKLATELSRKATGRTLYILDEPTTGLHFADVEKLLNILHRLVDRGNTVLIIEHNLEVIKTADWIIDLGPEGGEQGGYIIAEGPPEEIIKNPISYTGQFLKKVLLKEEVAVSTS
ncbi:excinuclease ABC subunit UvrA [bacterium]|nr:excinuclease ABC subunit UvrA [bacterium]